MIRVADSPVIPFQGTYDPEKEAPFAVLERAATRYIEDSDTGCWNSTYSRMSAGYSQVGWQRASGKPWMVLAHRAAWEYHSAIRLIGDETIDHLCRNRGCVNPSHMRVLSNFENARRTFGRDWETGFCINGHPNSDLRKNAQGRWECGTCVKNRAREYNRKRRAK